MEPLYFKFKFTIYICNFFSNDTDERTRELRVFINFKITLILFQIFLLNIMILVDLYKSINNHK